MRDVHTMGKFMFIVENAIYTYLAIKIYGIYFFVNLFDFDTFTSMEILIISMVISVIVGVMITINHRRNSLSTGINVTLPLEINSMLGYFRYVGLLITILLFFSALASVIYIVMTRQYSKSKLSKKIKGSV